MYHFGDRAVERVHRINRVFRQALDVAALSHCHRAVAKDGLDGVIIDPKAVKIRCQPTSESMPAMPSGQRRIAFVLVPSLRFVVPSFLFVAVFATVQRRKYTTPKDVV